MGTATIAPAPTVASKDATVTEAPHSDNNPPRLARRRGLMARDRSGMSSMAGTVETTSSALGRVSNLGSTDIL
jgi:hypothetical protein